MTPAQADGVLAELHDAISDANQRHNDDVDYGETPAELVSFFEDSRFEELRQAINIASEALLTQA